MKRWTSFIMIVIMLGCMCGCKAQPADTKTETPLGENMIYLYLATEDGVEPLEETYQLKTPDSVSSCVDDVLTALLANSNGRIEAYSYMMGEDSSLILELSIGAEAIEKEDSLLMMGAVTKTLFQLNDIASIRITVKAKDGNVLDEQLYLPDSFYFYGYEGSLAEEVLYMYVPTDNKQALKRVRLTKNVSPEVSDQELIVEELVSLGVLPAETKVNMVSVHDGLCYLDLSAEFLSGTTTVASELAIDALVDSIVEQCEVETVQILVDGQQRNEHFGTVDIGQPLSFHSNLIE